MSEEINGTTGVILLRLNTLDNELRDVKATVKLVRDHQLTHLLCSRPNTCIDLQRIIEVHDQAIRRLEKQEVRIVTICAIVAFFVPLGITAAVKLW